MAKRGPGEARPYQRKDGMWVAAIPAGYSESGARRRITVSAKTETACKRKLRDKRTELAKGENTASRITTVKQWADLYLTLREGELRPKAYNAAASPIRKWIVPTIGHRRLADLTPADIRAVATAQIKVGQQGAATHRVLHTMLERAIAEGHHVPARALKVKAPPVPKSDRQGMSLAEGLACLEVASTLPHGSRWLVTLLYGMREGECLGLTWDCVDFDAGEYGEIRVDWQLQALPYNVKGDKTSGFRVPVDLDVRHLVDAWHLTPPKTRQGFRVAPLLPEVRDALLRWQANSPPNKYGLVWPAADGTPANTKRDLEEWQVLQETAGVHHPTRLREDKATGDMLPGFYLVHECRNFAATMLGELGIDPHVITALLGHSSILTSRGYMNTPRGPLQAAMTRMGDVLQLGATPQP